MVRRSTVYTILGVTIGGLILVALLRLAWAHMTLDYYAGTVTQEPKIGVNGQREIAVLAHGAAKADTIVVEDFCMMPFTVFCRYDSADVHYSFIQGSDVCVSAYGWRFGWFSWKPNLVEVIDETHPDWLELPCPKG